MGGDDDIQSEAMKPPMLTVQQVATRLNIHHGLVRRLIANGTLPASKIGKEWRIEPDDVENFIVSTRLRREQAEPRCELPPIRSPRFR